MKTSKQGRVPVRKSHNGKAREARGRGNMMTLLPGLAFTQEDLPKVVSYPVLSTSV